MNSRKENAFVLGISCFYHDSAACLLKSGNIVAAAQEERFTRKKHDPRFPNNAVKYCLDEAGITIHDIGHLAYYDKPLLTFERLLMSYLTTAPKGLRSWLQAMPQWLGQKLHIPRVVRKETGYEGVVLFTEHHEAHAASAFYMSPYNKAAILTVDGVGEWATANSGEYKLMGLAPYGQPLYSDLILSELIDLKKDGSIRLNQSYFDYIGGLRMTNRRFSKLFGGPQREPETEITQREMDIAASIQVVAEKIILKMVNHVYNETKLDNLCLAGGVALNCVANGRIIREGPFKNVWIQPAAGDAGGALGAALSVWHRYLGNQRPNPNGVDRQKGSYLGPAYTNQEVKSFLENNSFPFHKLDKNVRARTIGDQIARGKIVGYMAGRMEFGPRALGARSILGDPRQKDTQTVMNLKIKYRESFRPFAPTVLEDKADRYFDIDRPSPYMLLVADVKEDRRLPQPARDGLSMLERLKVNRSDIPAVTHLDYSARLQSVNRQDKPDYYDVIAEFEKLTGCAVIVNTSFNVRGEPIICTPEDAYRCFMRTQIDVLVIEDCILYKSEQPKWQEGENWREELELD